MSGSQIITRPIKGTRPRANDPTRDAPARLRTRTSPKELAELVDALDLLRNDLGRICEYGSIQVPELARLEKFAQVQHLVSTVEGRLRPGTTILRRSPHVSRAASPARQNSGRSIIDELEPIARGPCCGAIGYLGFNRESQLSIAIRTAVCAAGNIHFSVGAGIVADSDPAAEYEETQAKARGFLAALATGQTRPQQSHPASKPMIT